MKLWHICEWAVNSQLKISLIYSLRVIILAGYCKLGVRTLDQASDLRLAYGHTGGKGEALSYGST